MRRLACSLGPVFVGAALLGLYACAAGEPPGFDPPGVDAPRDGGQFADGTPDDGGGACRRCSTDLHAVLKCDGTEHRRCADHEGCDPVRFECVSACDAARANKSTYGCDYQVVTPDSIPESAGYCHAMYIANTWTVPISIAIEYGALVLDIADFARIPIGGGKGLLYDPLPGGKLPPGKVAVLFLSEKSMTTLPCPVAPALIGDPAVHGTGIGTSYRVATSAPVVAYDIFPYGGGAVAVTGASLLLPVSAWGDNYLGVTAWKASQVVPGGYPFLEIVAAADDTKVTINPTVAIAAGRGVAATAAKVPATYRLNKGEYLQLTQPDDLIGSTIQSDKTVGVLGGHACMNIASDTTFCDSAHQQLPPVRALGHEYVAARYRNRIGTFEETPPWRVVGAVDGTTLSWEPSTPAGAPTKLGRGESAVFNAAGPFTVRSQDETHPFYVSGHMTGAGALPTAGYGDPDFVNVIPTDQYLASYSFFTDPTYPETNLVFVRAKGPSGFKDVNLDCIGTLQGWSPIGAGGKFEYLRVDLVRHEFQKQGVCDNGLHEAKSESPFGLTVWAWGSPETNPVTSNVSYAYPAGASVRPVNTVVVPVVPK